MPIYEYQCQKCKKTFSILVGISQEKPNLVCQYCGSKKLKKQLSTFGVNIKSNYCPANCLQKNNPRRKCNAKKCCHN